MQRVHWSTKKAAAQRWACYRSASSTRLTESVDLQSCARWTVIFSKFFAWTDLCYGTSTNTRLWSNSFNLRGVTDMQQGDPLGPILFALMLRRIIDEILDCTTGWKDEADAESPSAPRTTLFSFYMDDGVLTGRNHLYRRAYALLDSAAVSHCGLHVGPKCEL